MKSKSDLIKEMNRSFSLEEKIYLQIGELYSKHLLTKDAALLAGANEKVEVLRKVKERISELEKEFSNAMH